MRKEIDARGQTCPRPVIMTKKELDNMVEGAITSIVDNEVAKENVSKLANSLGYAYKVDRVSDEEYHIHISKGQDGGQEISPSSEGQLKDLTIAFTSNIMGGGSEELGRILMKSFMYTITEVPPFPSTLLFYNSGVYLTCQGSEVLEDLRLLKEEGVEIISCGTCLDYFQIQDKLEVGEVSNMYTIYEKLRNGANTITIG